VKLSRKTSIRNASVDGGFILLKPKLLEDADNVERAITACEGVGKVFITSGEFGFVIHAKQSPKYGMDKMTVEIKRHSGCAGTRVLNGHFVYESAVIKVKR